MTQEQKDILLKDLSARLPYKVKVQDTYYKSLEPNPIWLIDLHAQKVRLFADEGYQNIEYIKPYLFPLSSMTEEQKEKALSLLRNCDYYLIDGVIKWLDNCPIEFFDWCNENHFDYRGIIPMGLALDATDKNIY